MATMFDDVEPAGWSNLCTAAQLVIWNTDATDIAFGGRTDVTGILKWRINQIKVNLWLMSCGWRVWGGVVVQCPNQSICSEGKKMCKWQPKAHWSFEAAIRQQLSEGKQSLKVKWATATWQVRLVDANKPGNPPRSNSAKNRGDAERHSAPYRESETPDQTRTPGLQSHLIMMRTAVGRHKWIIFIID